MRTRAIFGCSGQKLGAEERAFFKDVRPWGFILFARNVSDRTQVRALTDALRETVEDSKAPVLIDQEGGRVARLTPPQWHKRPPAARLGGIFAKSAEMGRKAAYLNARLIAYDLVEIGINADCAPVLDVPVPGADSIIGDRAFAADPAAIIALGRTTIDGFLDGGVLPVMKHIPGHGRSTKDTHKALPHVDAPAETLSAADFVTFRSLNDCPMAMTAHIVYDAIDPHRPATLSPKVVASVIRGEIGFDGLLMSDDISMGALEGSLSLRTKSALFAGCDVVLHCNGKLDEMTEISQGLKPMEDAAERRAERALARLNTPAAFDAAEAEVRFAELLGAGA
jgi:beta-N-acetylhexosaminidase